MRCMAAARLVPELYCSDIERSVSFYVDLLGFRLRFSRPEERFVYLDREGAEMMLEQPTTRMLVSASSNSRTAAESTFRLKLPTWKRCTRG
jgi:catechol 2,3-dioxygenase-like lactoylglutathione lyase family enzyme